MRSITIVAALAAGLATAAPGIEYDRRDHDKIRNIQLGPRPFCLVENMDPGPLKSKLESCSKGPFHTSDFSIAHRGAPLQFPEHTKESYEAAARMGAGVIECDVTFTKDRQLVCRHSQCDLHTTTDILARPELAAKCSQGFSPADPATGKKATAKSFSYDDILYWIRTEPAFGAQAVFLDGRYEQPGFDHNKVELLKPGMKEMADAGVKILAPPIYMLLALNEKNEIVPSPYAKAA